MIFSKIFIPSIAILALGVSVLGAPYNSTVNTIDDSSPIEGIDYPGFVRLYSRKFGNGTLTYYGVDESYNLSSAKRDMISDWADEATLAYDFYGGGYLEETPDDGPISIQMPREEFNEEFPQLVGERHQDGENEPVANGAEATPKIPSKDELQKQKDEMVKQIYGERFCSGSRVQCGYHYTASRAICENLGRILAIQRGVPKDHKPRSVCHWENRESCCVSWNIQVYELNHDDLVPGLKRAINTCSYSGDYFAARVRGTQLGSGGDCIDQCISNTPSRC